MKCSEPGLYQASCTRRVRRSSPIEDATQPLFHHKASFHFHGLRIVVGDKPATTTHAVCSTNRLIYLFGRPLLRQVLVLECSFLSSISVVFTAYSIRSENLGEND